ncbi:MAG: HAD hydrolase-like protein [Deltaproteobacteria bacterium]|nr:HAD hydrolase-like protein [Deltaproteobacteria bacterium]
MNPKLDPSLIKAIVFDFDGTLARLNINFPVMRSSIRGLMADFQIPEAAVVDLHILEMIDAGGAYLEEFRQADAGIFRFRAHELVTRMEIESADEGALLDGTRMLLTELAGRSIRTGVVTRNCRIAVLKVFPDIARHCQAFLTREDTEHVKPHPDHLRSALRALGVVPAEAIMVGDHPLDILLGRETGTYTVGVLTGYSGREDLRSANADLIIDKASDIINIYF